MSLKSRTRPLRHALLRALVWFVSQTMRRLPLSWARWLGSFLGQTVYFLVPSERRRTLDSLAVAYPGMDLAWRRAMARRVYANLGQGGADFFRLGDMGGPERDAWVSEVSGLEHLPKTGAVLITGHFGNWELLGAWLAQRVPFAAIAREATDPRLDRALTRHREASHIKVFDRQRGALPLLRWLKAGKVLGILSDQDSSNDSLYCEFFGQPAKTPSGGAFLAQACHASLVTMYCWRKADGSYAVEIEPPIPLPARDERDPLALWPVVQEYTRRLEAVIRRHPEQWCWNHARWRSPIGQDSPGWQASLAPDCLARIEAWRAQGRQALA